MRIGGGWRMFRALWHMNAINAFPALAVGDTVPTDILLVPVAVSACQPVVVHALAVILVHPAYRELCDDFCTACKLMLIVSSLFCAFPHAGCIDAHSRGSRAVSIHETSKSTRPVVAVTWTPCLWQHCAVQACRLLSILGPRMHSHSHLSLSLSLSLPHTHISLLVSNTDRLTQYADLHTRRFTHRCFIFALYQELQLTPVYGCTGQVCSPRVRSVRWAC